MDGIHAWRATPTWWRWLIAVTFLVALAVRLPGLSDPPLEFAPVRQLHSAGLARAYYLADARPAAHPPGRVEAAAANKEPEIEPPLMERAAVLGYDALGSEELWWPRSLSVLWWIATGLVLSSLSLRLFGHHAALATAALHLLLPFGVRASRSFQPDPLMVLLVVGTALVATVAADSRSRRMIYGTIVVAGAAVFVKVVAAFFVLPLLAALAVRLERTRRAAARRAVAWGAMALAPAAAWNVYGRYVSGFLTGQDDGRIEPRLLWTRAFWEGWTKRVADVLPVPRAAALVLVAILAIGVAVAARHTDRRGQATVGALLGGYVVFGLVFTVHYSTHDYYHLPLVPVLALCLGLAWSHLVSRFGSAGRQAVASALLVAALAAPLGWEASSFRPSSEEIARRVHRSEAIGDLLHHSSAVGFVADDFGLSLTYFGDLSGRLWDPRAGESTEATFDRLFAEGGVDYLVVTDTSLADFTAIEPLVDRRFPVLREGPDWVVYDLRSG